MKKYVVSSQEITNNYLNELFKKLDWDDVDWADRLIDKTIKKYLGVDRVFDQAKYINMLDEDVKSDLMKFLEDPQAVHDRRVSGKKKSKNTPKANAASTLLSVRYEDYPDGNVRTETYEGVSRVDALKNMVDGLLLYLSVEEIEEDNLSAEGIIEELELRNGDGCDYIINVTDKSTGEVLMDHPYEEYD